MKLNEEDIKLFYKLDWGLMYYANQKYNIIDGITEPNFKGRNMQDIAKLKDKIFAKPDIIGSFVGENPLKFNEHEVAVVGSWKNFIKDKFFVYQHQKDYSVFLQGDKTPKAYGVIGITDPISYMIPYTPWLIETALLPFKGRIIYNGVFSSFNITFGGGIKRVLKTDYARAKANYGIITSLDSDVVESTNKDAELIRFYVQNAKDNLEYKQELIKLLDKKPELNNIYTYETGRKLARNYRRNLSHLNVRSCWFALFFDTIIASGESEKEALNRAKLLIPENEHTGIYVFRHEGRT